MDMKNSDSQLRVILRRTRCIACVGVSPNEVRPSYFVFRYMQMKGYRMIPVNPGHAGGTLLGEVIYRDLAAIPRETGVDMVDVFRRSEFVPEIAAQAVEHLPGLRTFWMQIGVEEADVAADLQGGGVDVVQNLCPKMEHQRLFGELRKAGINTGVISSRL